MRRSLFRFWLWMLALLSVAATPLLSPPAGEAAGAAQVAVEDIFGRSLNSYGITLVDWEGYLANPAIQIYLRPPASASFPANATLTANGVRLYFDNPSNVSASGPSKMVTFANASSVVPVKLSIFPDRDTLAETYTLNIALGSDTTALPIQVIDQDLAGSGPFAAVVDFSKDTTGFFGQAARRDIVEQAVEDWVYFFSGMGLDQVPAGAEQTWIWNSDGFNTGSYTTNASAYTGFLLYVYGIHSPALRSGGAAAAYGGFQSSGGVAYQLRRSGTHEVETQGNYNTLGWFLTTSDDDWWQSGNLSGEVNDLYSISHHEIGHALVFNPAYPAFNSAKTQGYLTSDAIMAYHGKTLPIDASDHFAGEVDPASQRGIHGNEYYGNVPARRWLITKLDLLAAQAVGYQLRATSAFASLAIATTSLPFGGLSTPYAQTLQATGGIPFYNWTVDSGSLPPGLSLNSFTGAISGTPTQTGVYNFTIRARDYQAGAAGVTRALSLTIGEQVHSLYLPQTTR